MFYICFTCNFGTVLFYIMFYMYFGTFIIDSKLFCYVLPVIWVLTLLQHLSFTFFPHLKNRTVLNNLKRVLFDTWSSLPLNNWQIKHCILISYSNVIKFLWHHVHSHGLGSTKIYNPFLPKYVRLCQSYTKQSLPISSSNQPVYGTASWKI